MKVDWAGLKEGLRNKLLPPEELKELIESTYQERIAICNNCEFKRNSRCGKCGCILEVKTRCLSCNCPISKWTQKIDRDTDDIVKLTVNGNY